MTEMGGAVLQDSAVAVAARLALERLGEAREAELRLADATDVEALHDFRVAVRRLRSTIRNFRPELDHGVSRKLRGRLRELSRSTAAARDAEVLGERLDELVKRIPTGRRGGIAWFRSRLKRRRSAAYDDIQDEVMPAFHKVERRLRKALSATKTGRGESLRPYGTVVGGVITESVKAVQEELATFESPADDAAGHRARILAKHLRYLLEPLAAVTPRAKPLIASLKQFQDALGEIHDLQILAVELAQAVADAGAERARAQHERVLASKLHEKKALKGPRAATPGLLALAGVVHDTRRARFERFNAEWRDRLSPELWRDCAALAIELAAAAAAPSPPEDIPARDFPAVVT